MDESRPKPRYDDHLFEFLLKCRSCKAQRKIKLVAYPFTVGQLLPKGFGGESEAANCHRCGRAEMEIMNAPPQKTDVIPPVGFTQDPNKK